jgi:coatomer protein complex subunit alpha (xenin)
MTVFSKAGNNATAAVFAGRLIEMKADATVMTKARAVQNAGNRNPRDAHSEINYDQFAQFTVCPASLTPITTGMPAITAAFTGARYLPEYKSTVCVVDGITQVGLPASGLRSAI